MAKARGDQGLAKLPEPLLPADPDAAPPTLLGSSSLFTSDYLGLGGVNPILAEIKRRVWIPLCAPTSLLGDLGVTPVRGMLLHGPPGCGKTAIARGVSAILSPNRPVTVVAGPEIM